MSRWILLAAAGVVLYWHPVGATEPQAVGGDGVRQFAVECRIIDAASGKQQAQQCPKVTVFDHKQASITDLVLRPFVVAVSPTGDKSDKPQIEVLPEGWTIDLCCHGNAAGLVTLDVTIEQSKIGDVEVIKLDDQTSVQQPQVQIEKSRHFVAARSGEPFKISLDGRPAGKSKRWAEFVVSELGGEAK